VGYFTINTFINDGYFDVDFLEEQPALYDNDIIRHVRFEKPLIAKLDGKKNLGVIFKPENGS
jgi:hypothetical protein